MHRIRSYQPKVASRAWDCGPHEQESFITSVSDGAGLDAHVSLQTALLLHAFVLLRFKICLTPDGRALNGAYPGK